MSKELLIMAKRYQKELNWHKAIECLEQYMNNHEGTCDPSIYLSYAKSLRISGQTAAAKTALIEGRKHHPANERLVVEFHILYDFLGEWMKAKNTAKYLLKMNPGNADYHFRLGRSCSFLQENKNARNSYQKALELRHEIPLNKLITKIQRRFPEPTQKIRSKYIFIDGKNNFGALIHEAGHKRYFTKISSFSSKDSGAGREELFYKGSSAFPKLQNMIPRFVDSQVIDGISYITMEIIDSTTVKPAHLKQIIQASNTICSISYTDSNHHFGKPKYVFQFKKGRGISVVHFFSQIHEEKTNRKMFDSLYLIMKQHRYPSAIKQLINRVESIIMPNRIFKKIIPEKHYSLLHGDFAWQNIMISKSDQAPRVIDWTSFTTGPRFIDIARYLTSLLMPYSAVKEHYLADTQTGGKLEDIEHIFFLYALIIFYFQKLGRKGIETQLTDYLLPAIEDLELLAAKYIQRNMGVDRVKDQMNVAGYDENELKIHQLEHRVSVLEEERNYMHKRLNDVLTSKSWKITMPLRLFTEQKKKESITKNHHRTNL